MAIRVIHFLTEDILWPASSGSCYHNFCARLDCNLEAWAKIKFTFFKFLLLSILVTATRKFSKTMGSQKRGPSLFVTTMRKRDASLFRIPFSWCKKISCFGHNSLALYVLVWFLGWDKFLIIISFHLIAAENETTSYYTWPHFKVFMRYLLSSTSLSHISQSGYHPQNVNILVMSKLTANLEIKACLLLTMYSYMNYLYTLEVSVYFL